MTEREQRLFFTILYYAALGAAAFFCLRYLLPWLLPFVLGAGLAALLHPFSLRMAKRLRWNEKTAALSVIIGFYLVVVGTAGLFLAILLAQGYELLLRLPELYAQTISPMLARAGTGFNETARRFLHGPGPAALSEAVSGAAKQAFVDGSAFLVAKLASMAAKLPHFLLTMLFTVIISLLTASGYDTMSAFIRQVIPPAAADFTRRFQRFLRETLWQYLRAYTILMAVTFLELSAGLWLLGFSYVLPVAATIALVDLLPILGCGTVLVPWGVFLLAGGDPAGGAGLLILYGVIALVRAILEPRVVGGHLGLHPVATITAMYAGLQIAGLAGMLTAPMAVLAVLKLGKSEEKTVKEA